MYKKALTGFLTLSLLLTALTGCSKEMKSTAAPEVKKLTFGLNQSTPSIDPVNAYSGWYTVRYGVGETLFRLDSAMKPVPWLAKSYERIDDGTWKITLNDKVTFHNGKPMTGDAVKASLERTLKLNDRAPSTLNIAVIAASGQTLTIKTAEPNPTLINGLCDPFACVIDVDAGTDFETAVVGTGPYKIEKFVPKAPSTVVKYSGYWNGTPKLDQVTLSPITNGDTQTMALQSGEIDAAQGLPYASLKLFTDNPAYKVSSTSTSRVFMLYYNYQNEFLKNANVRKAISMCVDKENYSSTLLSGSGEPATGAYPSALPYGSSKVTAAKFDTIAAKELLAKEGFTDSNGDGILDKNGEKLSLKLVTYSTRYELPILSQALQSQLKDVGIEVEIVVAEDANNRLKAGDFDLAAYSYVTAPTGDPLAYLDYVFKNNGVSNFGRFSNTKVDTLIEELRKEFDPEKRTALTIQIQQLALDETAFTFMAHLQMKFVMKSNVVGLEVHPTDYYQINVNTDIVKGK